MAAPAEVARREGVRMSEAEVDAFLTEQGDGVLALADADDAYAIPISFGYVDRHIYFVYFRFVDSPMKEAYSEATHTACLTAYTAESPTRWRSVIVRGPLTEVGPDRWSEVGSAISDNAWSPDLSTIGPRHQLVRSYELTPETVTGLQGRDYA